MTDCTSSDDISVRAIGYYKEKIDPFEKNAHQFKNAY